MRRTSHPASRVKETSHVTTSISRHHRGGDRSPRGRFRHHRRDDQRHRRAAVSHGRQRGAPTGTGSPRPPSARFPARTVAPRRPSRSTWAWSRGPCTTRSTRSARKQYRPYVLETRTGPGPRSTPRLRRPPSDVLTALVTDGTVTGALPRSCRAARHALARRMPLRSRDPRRRLQELRASPSGTPPPRRCSRHAGRRRFGPHPGSRTPRPGHWQPLLVERQSRLDPTPWAGTWTLPRREPVAVPVGPPRRTSTVPQWADGAQRGQGAWRATGSTRTTDQTYIAKWWQSAPSTAGTRWPASSSRGPTSTPPTAPGCWPCRTWPGRTRAITCWNDKYHFDFWRPWNAIVRGRRGRQPATDRRPGLDGAHHGALPGVDLGPQLPRRRPHQRAPRVLR